MAVHLPRRSIHVAAAEIAAASGDTNARWRGSFPRLRDRACVCHLTPTSPCSRGSTEPISRGLRGAPPPS